jgi:DNA-binding protein Fis
MNALMIKYTVYKLVNLQAKLVCLALVAFCFGCGLKSEDQEDVLRTALQNYQNVYYSALVNQDSSRLSEVVTEPALSDVLEFYNRNLSQSSEVIYIQRTVVERVLVLESDDVNATLFVDLLHHKVRFNKVTGEQEISSDPPRKSAATIHLKFVEGTWKFDGVANSN